MYNLRPHIERLFEQLLPTGLAFRGPSGGWLNSLNKGLALSENRAVNDALSLLNMILPDNDDFSVEDAEYWERALGMIDGTGVPLADRKQAIARKMSHPGNTPARQHHLYIQSQLQAAGFDVYVYENRFPAGGGNYSTQDPLTLWGGTLSDNQLGDNQLGDSQLAGKWGDVIVNHIDQDKDLNFNIGSNLRSTFFIAGPTLTTPCYVQQNREQEFRQLVLKLKPVQTAAYLYIVYL